MAHIGNNEPDACPFTPPTTCTISEGELAGLSELLQNVTQPFSEPDEMSPSSIGNDANSATGVDSKFHDIRNVALELRRKFQTLLRERVPQATFDEMKRSYEDNVKQLKREIDEVTKNAKESERLVVDRLKFEFQKMQYQTGMELGALLKEREAHRETQTLLCIAEIKNIEVDSAVEKFSELDDNKLLGRIVKTVYANNVENTEKILQFVEKLPNLEQHVLAHSVLYDEMNRNNHLKSDCLLLLASRINVAFSSSKFNQLTQHLQTQCTSLKDTLSRPIQDVISILSVTVRNGNSELVQKIVDKNGIGFDPYLNILIQQAYANNKANTENILEFINNLTSITHHAIALTALYEEMNRNGHLQCVHVLCLAYRVRAITGMTCYSQLAQDYHTKLSSVHNALSLLVQENILITVSLNLTSGNYHEVTAIAKTYEAVVEFYLKKIIELAYANKRENTESILKFVEDLPVINQVAIATTALFHEMARNDHLLTKHLFCLAFQIKEAMLNSNLSTENKAQLESVKAELPEQVVNIIWHDVCIKHVPCNEYLFAAADNDMGSEKKVLNIRLAFTYKSPGVRLNRKGDWNFESLNNGRSFRIKNVLFGEYLAVYGDSEMGSRRVLTVLASEKMEWEIELYPNMKSIRIKNVATNEYMYAAHTMFSYSWWNRSVFTWQPAGQYDGDMPWQVYKC